MNNFSSTTKIYWMNKAIFFLWRPHLYQVCFVSDFMGTMVGVTILNILKITKAMLMNFCIVNTPRYQILILGAKYFADFSRFLPLNRLFQKMDCIEKSNPSPPSTPVLTLLSYSSLIRVKMLVLKAVLMIILLPKW